MPRLLGVRDRVWPKNYLTQIASAFKRRTPRSVRIAYEEYAKAVG